MAVGEIRHDMLIRSRQDVDRAIVDLWRGGVRVQGHIGQLLGLDQRAVSRRIARMVRTGTWPFRERPVRGRTRTPVASGFVVIPIRQREAS
ncbi:MAG TPA: hypothetical protein VGW35_05645 [Methylomirabilota bacterium]|jgi:hypothetical protein|nr:hypothetical protein [Methylomirabilota bacterium]